MHFVLIETRGWALKKLIVSDPASLGTGCCTQLTAFARDSARGDGRKLTLLAERDSLSRSCSEARRSVISCTVPTMHPVLPGHRHALDELLSAFSRPREHDALSVGAYASGHPR